MSDWLKGISRAEFAEKYDLYGNAEHPEYAERRDTCEREGHLPELTFGADVSKFVGTIVCRCSRCHEIIESGGDPE